MAVLTVTPRHQVQAGASDGNWVCIDIEASEDVDLMARLEIPCGYATSSQSFLCRDAQVSQLKVVSDPVDAIDGLLDRKGTVGEPDHLLTWDSSNVFALEAQGKTSLRITGFNPVGSGRAKLRLKIWSDPDQWVQAFDQEIEVPVASSPGPAIIDFNAGARCIMQNETVELTAYTVNAKTVILYGDNTPITPSQAAVSPAPGEGETKTRFTHTPQKTTQYRLEAWRDKANGSPESVTTRELTVQVDPRPHWYSWDLLVNSLVGDDKLPGHYPTLLLPAMDLSGRSAGKRLYGIFVNPQTKEAGLWSSASGLDGWRWESDVPAGMHESPGVIHQQVLWLVGGSSVNPLAPATNRVWWYYLDKNTNKMVWKEWDPEGVQRAASHGPVARKCHACASFDGKVWVLGGLSQEDQELDDAWACAADPRDGDPTAAWSPQHKLPSGRCLSAAAVTPAHNKVRGISKPRLWLFGGTTHPYNIDETIDQLLWTEDGKSWHELALPRMTGGAQMGFPLGAPLGAALLFGEDGYLHLAGVFREPGPIHVGWYKLMGVDLQPISWLAESLLDFAWDYQTDLFRIGAVAFAGRFIFWPGYQDWTGKEHYMARVYNTP